MAWLQHLPRKMWPEIVLVMQKSSQVCIPIVCAGFPMDNWVIIVGTAVPGVVGVLAFLAMSPGETKTRSAKSGLKPREDLYAQ